MTGHTTVAVLKIKPHTAIVHTPITCLSMPPKEDRDSLSKEGHNSVDCHFGAAVWSLASRGQNILIFVVVFSFTSPN